MKSNIRDFLHSCETTDFGGVTLSKMERRFYRRFNKAVISLCRSLPESAQTDSMLFLMPYAGLNIGDELDFFAHYYSPIWSILYWVSRHDAFTVKRLKKRDVTNAITAQSMAMFLHSLDDHLIDSQVSVSLLILLLRSQAWTIMNRGLFDLAEGVPTGGRTVRNFIDDYYSSIQDSKEPQSLNRYCDLFRKQMAIVTVAPVLLSMKMTGLSNFTREIEIAYGSFGIAWRLLDDIRDIEQDIKKGTHSAIYLCLSKKMRTHWNNNIIRNRTVAEDSTKFILNHILEHSLIEKIKGRIWAELETAASMVETHNLTGLGREFRYLAYPLKSSRGIKEEGDGKSRISLASK